jgi:hypothetical protein
VFNEFVEWDDFTFIVANPRFNPPTWDTLRFYWTHAGFNLYMPVSYVLWAGLAKLAWLAQPDPVSGTHLNPYVFHFCGVLLHVIAGLAVFGITRRLVGADLPAAVGALLYTLHPLQVESVAFIGTMNTPIAGALALLAVWLFGISGDDDGGNRAQQAFTRWRRPSFLLATLLLAMALLSKSTAVVAPALALVFDWAANQRRGPSRSLWATVLALLPWFVLTIPCLVWTKLAQPAPGIAALTPIWARPLIAGDSLAFYMRRLLWPHPLAIDYGRTPQVMLNSPWLYVNWLAPAALLLVAWWVYKRKPIVAAGIAAFIIGVLPNSGIVPFDYQQFSTTADRYVYLAMTGVALLVAVAVSSGIGPGGARRTRSIVAAVVVVLACIVLTERQIQTWRDGETLFRHAVQVDPRSWMSWENLANVIADRDPQQAIAACRRAIAINPSDPSAYNNLGSILMSQQNPRVAAAAFAEAHRLAPENPTFASNYARATAATTPVSR